VSYFAIGASSGAMSAGGHERSAAIDSFNSSKDASIPPGTQRPTNRVGVSVGFEKRWTTPGGTRA
jgi:hypothetical protein